MPARRLVAKELATLLNVLSHPVRVHVIEELAQAERDVAALSALLGVAPAGVSQHLALMRAHRLVAERREGRRVIYRLRCPELAAWLTSGLDFIGDPHNDAADVRDAVQEARAIWRGSEHDAAQ